MTLDAETDIQPTSQDNNAASKSGHLSLVELTKIFGDSTGGVTAVDHINLDIKPGEFITLLGPSGCGKTTTLRMIAGFEDASSGKVMLDGDNMAVVPPNRRPMSMVFQSYALFPHLSVREMSAAQMDEAIEVALTSMNLTAMAKRAPSQLSGGQQQRVALARAMVVRPKVLLFDEPLSNLDAKLRIKMRLEIRHMQKRLGITSVYVTHDQSEAMAMSDRIVVMNSGHIEQVDTPAEIYLHPASVFVADFVGRANFLVATVTGRPDTASGTQKCATVRVLGSEATVPAHPDALDDGRDVVLMVRPESVRLTAAHEPAQTISGSLGQIITRVFYGETVEYEVETEYGSIVCVVADPHEDEFFQEGQAVRVSIESSKAWLLPAEANAPA